MKNVFRSPLRNLGVFCVSAVNGHAKMGSFVRSGTTLTVAIVMAMGIVGGDMMAAQSSSPASSIETIVLVPLGPVDEATLDYLKSELAAPLHRTVVVGAPLPLPASAYDPKRKQYESSKILETLIDARRNLSERWLGVTGADLFIPSLNFVFGEADAEHRLAVISLARLRPELYHQRPDPGLLHLRALKEATHELGHTYGLGHCDLKQCVMYFSNSIHDTDRKSANFCAKHRKELDEKLKSVSR